MKRLARRITGCAVGLVLGGGGARGLAHVGVIAALEEQGISVDMVGGTSIGSAIGGLYAKHPDNSTVFIQQVQELSRSLGSIMNQLLDLTLPFTSYFSGQRMNEGLKRHFGADTQIQDLLLPYFCTTTDILNHRINYHHTGPLWRFSRASMTLQGYMPPISVKGQLLLDGGYLDNLPVQHMKACGAAVVIAVDVSGASVNGYDDYGDHLSGWKPLLSKLNPFAKTMNVPSAGDIAGELLYVSSTRHSKDMAELADLYLKPPVQEYGTLEFGRFDVISQAGYNYAKPILQEFALQLRTSPIHKDNTDQGSPRFDNCTEPDQLFEDGEVRRRPVVGRPRSSSFTYSSSTIDDYEE
eukprot:TRINITY_DN55407_c0_g1_i2.p1 TRINITY_DN55407_c0_g1~~TRINITY_DN55407_c0_g1_i2.p1  ORF type:complete len:353 (-),score=70.09 TRINITY_DN55407_c0_g1_i2:117-1175(-)